jgi:predicted methyltransferase
MRRASKQAAGTLLVSALAAAAALAAGAHAIPKYVTDAVADNARPQEDRARDADRKPAQTLAFAGVKPGDRVYELAPGRGYYTRLLSAVVGARGKVYTSVRPKRPDAPADAPPPPVRAIAADPHYANVEVSEQQISQLKFPEGLDLVWTSQNYHDFHNVPDLDVAKFDKDIFQALKPGGIYLVLDHAAQAGSGIRDTSTLHRIDPEAVKKEVESAGFRLEGESEVLGNKNDPHTEKVFDSAIQGHTDQFILKFRKPK